jgi:coenzyme F420 hydrogenase subunit beta
MVETPSGLLYAKINHPNCNFCGACIKVCPGSHIEKKMMSKDVDPFKGSIVAAYCGQAIDKKILRNGRSGGIATALLCHMLDTREIERAVVTQMPEDGSLRPKCILTNNKEEIYKAQGSKYCPVALNMILSRNIYEEDNRIAIVGLPCHVHGLHNVQFQLKGKLDLFVIGLICSGILSYLGINHLIDEVGELPQNIISLQYTSKKWRGWPGDLCFRTHSGDLKFLSRNYRGEIKSLYCPVGCRLCFDKINIFSDLALGDPFNIRETKEGWSVIIARTQKGNKTLLAARDAGVLRLDKIQPETVFMKHVENRRRDWTSFTTVWTSMGKVAPDFNIDEQWYANIDKHNLMPYRKKITWSMRFADMPSGDKIIRFVKRKVLFHNLVTLSFVKTPLRWLNGLFRHKGEKTKTRHVEKSVD